MIVVTGAAGFIGSCFLWKLNQEGRTDIIAVDSLGKAEKWKNLSGKRYVDYLQKDDFIDRLRNGSLRDITHIVHLGACSSTTETDAGYLVANNYEYSKELAQYALSRGIYFMYASSAATYGAGEAGYNDDTSALDALTPLNMYGYSKHMFDQWVVRNGFEDKVVGFKYFNVFGPNEYHKTHMMSVICRKYPEIMATGKITLFKSYRDDYADGEQKRDFVYVKDVVDVMYHFFSRPDVGGIFNLGTGQAHSWNELARAMFDAAGMEPVIEYIDMPEHLKEKYQYFTQADMDKLRAAGCGHRFMSLEDSVKDYIGSYLAEGRYL